MTGFERCDKCGRSDIELNFAGTHLLCERCATRNGSMRSAVLADHTINREEENYNQDQDQDQDQVLPSAVNDDPGPGGNSEPNWLEIALDEHRKGNLEPFEVELGPMPARAGSVMRAIAEHMRFLIGLRRALGDERPLPYATSMAVKAGLAPDKGTASHAIHSLEKFGVIEYRGQLKPLRPGIDGTKLYAPPGY